MDRVDDLVVTGAAADVAGDRFLDILGRRFSGAVEQYFDRHDVARRAVAALYRAGVDKGLLNRMQLIAVRKPLDGRDLGAVGVGGHGHARVDRLAIVNDRAGAALAGVAAELAALHLQGVAEKFQQRRRSFRDGGDGLAVDFCVDGDAHYATSLPLAAFQVWASPRRVNASTIQRRFSALLR